MDRMILFYYLVTNVLLFFFMAYDKRAAIRKWRRISEASLFGLAFLGGAGGGLLGMLSFRHKTKKWAFRLLFPFAFLLHFLLILFLSVI